MDGVVAKTWTFSNDPADAGCTMKAVPARRSAIERTSALALVFVSAFDNFLEGGGEGAWIFLARRTGRSKH